MASRLRAWHLAAAGFAAQCAFAAYAWFESPPEVLLDVVTHVFVVGIFVGVGAVGILPAALLRSANPATHQAGRWWALGLGVAGVLSLFWVLQGLLLLAAFGWATLKERPRPAPHAANRPPSPP